VSALGPALGGFGPSLGTAPCGCQVIVGWGRPACQVPDTSDAREVGVRQSDDCKASARSARLAVRTCERVVCPDCGEVDGFHSGVCSSLTGVHHVGWTDHAQRGTPARAMCPYDDSDTTGGTW
jgi:hypothetical protein